VIYKGVDMEKRFSNAIRIYALGGLCEVGKNTYCLESENNLIIIDAGVKFPEDELTGVDYVIPNYQHLKDNQSKIRALIITHGHEDHIGGIPFLAKTIKIPVIYAPRLAAALIRQKLEDQKIKENIKIVEYDSNDVFNLPDFTVSFYRVTHSIPDSFGICIDTSEGRIVDTGDFKIDLTPVGPEMEIHKMAKLGSEGVDLLLADSTNAEREGWTPSEKNVLNSIHEIFDKANGRLIISTFSSNIYRIQQIIDCVIKHNRKVYIVGRSMVNTVEVSRKFGYIKIPNSLILGDEELKSTRDSQIVILCTGSQGEPMAALSRIANGTFKGLRIQPGDTVVFSSSPIPGNGLSISKVVNQLTRAGADVLTNSVFKDIHSSGHPSRQELRMNLKLLKPTYFMPAHGEYHMLKLHAGLAASLGIPKENIFVHENGDTLILERHKIREGERIPADDVYIDGYDINGVSSAVIKDRHILQDDGLVSVIVSLDSKNNKILDKPKIITVGFVSYGNYEDHLVRHASLKVEEAINNLFKTQHVTFNDIKNTIRSVVYQYYYRKTQRQPMIIPLILNKTAE
jgi:ribonuclease J